MASFADDQTVQVVSSGEESGLVWPDSAEIPAKPGCYTFSDADGRVLYIGKSANLRTRLVGYRQGRLHGNMNLVLSQARQVTWITLPSDAEALWAEAQMIAKLNPVYNLRLNTNPSPYPYVVITGEKTPRIGTWRLETGSRTRREGGRLFGPFPGQGRALTAAVSSTFGLRTCAGPKFRQHQRMSRACLLGETGTCSAPCVNDEGYLERVSAAVTFMEGDTKEARRMLTERMHQAAQERNFEYAAALRDRMELLGGYQLRRSLASVPGRVDAVGIVQDEAGWCCSVVHVQDGLLLGSTTWEVERADAGASADEDQALVLAVARCWDRGDHGLPQRVLAPSAHTALADLLQAAAGQQGGRRPGGKSNNAVRFPRGDSERSLANVAQDYAVEQLAASRRARLADSAVRVRELEDVARLVGSRSLLKVECLDVSHWRGTDTVAGLSVLKDGLPVAREESTYLLGSGEDDYVSMYKAVSWRVSLLQSDSRESAKGGKGPSSAAPDLLLIDGGPGQVEAAVRACAEAGVELLIAGLSKRLEEVWLPGLEDPVIVPRSSAGLYLLQRARDRAHNIAIVRQRALRRRRLLRQGVEDISGLGTSRLARLHQEGGIEPLLGMSSDEVKSRHPWLPTGVCVELAARLALPGRAGA